MPSYVYNFLMLSFYSSLMLSLSKHEGTAAPCAPRYSTRPATAWSFSASAGSRASGRVMMAFSSAW